MTKLVNFYLGPDVGLSQRVLTIRRQVRAGDDAAPAAEVSATLSGTAETSSQTLSSNTIFEATLVDTLTGGGTSETDVLIFSTGENHFPGPRSGDRLQVLSIEDLSSSSSSSSVSSSSVSSSSSSSVSSSSSSSASSSSSQSA